MSEVRHEQVLALPAVLEPGTIYFVDQGNGTCVVYVTNTSGTITARRVEGLTGNAHVLVGATVPQNPVEGTAWFSTELKMVLYWIAGQWLDSMGGVHSPGGVPTNTDRAGLVWEHRGDIYAVADKTNYVYTPYIEGKAATTATDNFLLEALVYISPVAHSGPLLLNGSNSGGMTLGLYQSSRPIIMYGQVNSIIGPNSVSGWVHLVAWRNAGNSVLYANGVKQGTMPSAPRSPTANTSLYTDPSDKTSINSPGVGVEFATIRQGAFTEAQVQGWYAQIKADFPSLNLP